MKRDRALLALAFVGFVLARALEYFALSDVPHVMDEIIYTYQAKTMAGLHLQAPTALPRAAFGMWFVEDRGPMSHGIFPPGWPALLAVATVLHVQTFLNPLLHAVTVFMLGRAVTAMGGRRAGLFAAAFYVLSPQALLLAASRMSHTSVALASVLVIGAIVSLSRKDGARRALLLGGVGIGFAVLARPLCAVVLAGPLAIAFAVGVAKKRVTPLSLLPLALPSAGAIALLLAYNQAVTGAAFLFPQTHYFDSHPPPLDIPVFRYQPGCNSLGFGKGHGCEFSIPDATHTLANAASNTGDNLGAWFWLACGGPVGLLLASYAVARGPRRPWLVAAMVPSVIGLYGLYWYSGECYGARFYHAALPALIACAALGAARLRGKGAVRSARKLGVGAALVVCAVSVLMLVRAGNEIGRDYWGTDARFAKLRHSPPVKQAVVMVAFEEPVHPDHRGYPLTSYFKTTYWMNGIRVVSALGENAPTLDSDIVFAKYHPALVQGIRDSFPGRTLHLMVVRDGAPDRLEPYDTSTLRTVGQDLGPPRDNWDAFVFPPNVLQEHPCSVF
jgi:hypothetical protein